MSHFKHTALEQPSQGNFTMLIFTIAYTNLALVFWYHRKIIYALVKLLILP